MEQIDLWLAIVGSLVLALSLGAGFLRDHSSLPSEPILATVVGVAVGPVGFEILQLSQWGDPLALLEQVARITVALAVTSIALRLPPEYYRGRARSLAAILGPGMVIMWLASSLVVFLLIPVEPGVALLAGAVVTPTDPVLANSIVVGRTAQENIPKRLRFLLSGEAGINDGAAYPFVFLAILVLSRPADAAIVEWLTHTLLWAVLGAVVLGFTIGAAIGRLEHWASSEEFLEQPSVFTITVALTFAVLGATKLVGTDDILAVFVAGVAYNWLADPDDEAEEQRVEEVFNWLFTFPVFVIFGTLLPWGEWLALGWRAPALVTGILLFRRLPMIFALRRFLQPLDRTEATLFVGWFGPIGIAAVFYALVAASETGNEMVWIVGSLVVAGSILAHGFTATPATHRYGELQDDDDSW